MKYELLQEGEVIKEGDEYWVDKTCTWAKATSSVGEPKRSGAVFIRPLPDKPKVRLEEIIKVVSESLRNSKGINAIEKTVALDVLAYLNIELEEPKPEWEVAFESFPQVKVKGMENCAVGGCFVSKGDFKAVWEAAMFEAGQKSREGK